MGEPHVRPNGHAGVSTLLGNPRKAVLKLAWPMMLAQAVQLTYNLIGAFWVSGLGVNALTAVGFFFPFMFMVMAIAMGMGMGGSSAVSRCIGAGDRERAGRVATHTVVIMAAIAVAMTLPLLMLARPMFSAMGAGPALEDTVAFSRIMFSGTIILFFVNVANSLLWGEGDAKRAMKAMLLGAVINIILDPIMIYTLGLGVTGAAWATLTSLSITAGILFYWLFLERGTYVTFRFRGFRFDRDIVREILRVGLPTSVQQLTMSINMIILNVIIVGIGGTDGVAVLTTGWRITSMGILPLMGIATAVVSVCGAAYGMKRYRRMEAALGYAIRIGLALELAAAAAILLLAGPITSAFTKSAASIAPDLERYFHITWLFLPGVALGMLSGSMFQGTGNGWKALAVTVLRTVVLTPPLAYGLAMWAGMGLEGVWLGLVLANVIGSSVSYVWARAYMRGLRRSAS